MIFFLFAVIVKSEPAPFAVNHGDSVISDNFIDFNNRGFYNTQDYINLIEPDNNFKLLVNTVNGNLFHQRTDYISDENSLPIRIVFTYNSGSSFKGRYGNFWQLNYNIRYADNNYNGHKIVVYPDDRTALFQFDSISKNYSPYFFSYDSLFIDGTGKVKFKFTDNVLTNEKRRFTASFDSSVHHYATNIKDAYDNEIRLEYTDDKKLKTIHYASGKIIILEYDGNFLSRIILPGGIEISYFYDASANLSSVLLPSGKYYLYKYDECGNLTNIISNTKEIFIDYDENYKVSTLINNYQNLNYSFLYDTTEKKTTLVFPDKTEKYYYFDSLERSIEYSYEKDVSFRKSWNNRNLQISRRDASNSIWNYSYDDWGRIKAITYPNNSTSTFTWDNQNRTLNHLTPSGDEIRYKFDIGWNIRHIENSIGEITEIFRYNNGTIADINFGNDLEVGLPRDNQSRIRFLKINGSNHLKIDYNFDDELTSLTDIFNNTTHFDYDQAERLVSINYPNGSNNGVFYLDIFQQAIVVDRNEGITEYKYDKTGRTTSIKDEIGTITDFNYDEYSEIVFGINNKYNAIKFGLNSKISSIVYFDDKIVNYEYDNRNNLISLFSNGLKHSFKYNEFSDVTEYISPNGFTRKYSYNPNRLVNSYTNETGKITSLVYDNAGRITKKSIGDISIFYTYDKNDLVSISYNDLYTVSYSYDFFGFIKTVNCQNSDSYFYDYDIAGNLKEITKNNLFTHSYNFNESYKIDSIIFPNGYEVSFKYSPSLKLTNISDKSNYSTQIIYDNHDRISEIIDENGYSRKYNWDIFNNLTSFTNKNSSEYKFKFGSELITVTNPDNSLISYNGSRIISDFQINTVSNPGNVNIRLYYDKNGNLTRVADDNAKQLTAEYYGDNSLKLLKNAINESYIFTYDYFGRVLNITNPENNNKTFSYNELSYIKELTDFSGLKYIFDFKTDGRFSGVQSHPFKLSYTYNSFNQLTSFSSYDSELLFFKYEYDNITQISSKGKDTVNLSYDSKNRISTKKNESGDIFAYLYQPNGFIKQINSNNGSSIVFQRNGNGNITGMDLDGNRIWTFNYNNSNKLAGVISLDTNISLGYNLLGELVQISGPGSANYQFTYDYLGRRNSIRYPDDKREFFGFDNKSNIKKFTARDGQEFDYEYNYRNQAVKFKWARNDSVVVNYSSDGDIVSIREPNSTVSEFVWTSGNVLHKINLYDSGEAELRTFNNPNNHIKLLIGNGDTLTYLFDDNLRFGGILRNETGKIQYDDAGRQLNKFDIFKPFNNFYNENYIYKNAKLSTIIIGNDSIKFQYPNRSLLPDEMNSKFSNYKLFFNDKYKPLEIRVNDLILNKLTYNSEGLISGLQNADNSYTFSYNNTGHIIRITDFLDYTTYLSYNNSNYIEHITDSSNNWFTFNYDNKGNVRSIDKNDNNKIEYLYDTYSNLIIIKNETGDETGLRYNVQNLPVSITYPDLSISEFRYDKWLNTINIKSNNIFNIENNLIWDFFSINKNSKKSFNKLFNIDFSNNFDKLLQINNISIRDLVLDNQNTVKEIKIANGKSVKINKQNNQNIIQFPNGITYIYEKTGSDKESIKIRNSAGQIIKEYTIFYNLSGKITKIEEGFQNVQNIEYDKTGRIINYKINSDSSVILEYTLDSRIKYISTENQEIVREFNAINRLLHAGDFELGYDDRGNLISKFDGINRYTYKYNFDNKLIQFISPESDTVNILYSPGNHLTGLLGRDSTYFTPFTENHQEDYPFIRSKHDNKGNLLTVSDYLDFNEFTVSYYYDKISNKAVFPILLNNNTILGYSDSAGSFYSLAANISPLGELSDLDTSQLGFLSFNNMIYMPQLQLYYDGSRFYDPMIKQFLQEKNLEGENPLNAYNLDFKDRQQPAEREYLAIPEEAVFALINPFDNRFINIKEEANPYKILNDELNLHFNDFKNFGLKTFSNYEIPSLDESVVSTVTQMMILENLNCKTGITLSPKLPQDLLDTLFQNYNIPILPEPIKKTPTSFGVQKIYDYVKLTDIPEGTVVTKVLKKILSIPNPLSEIEFNNVYDESPPSADLKTLEQILAVNNTFNKILKDNLHDFKVNLNSPFDIIKDYLPKVSNTNDFPFIDILKPARNVSQTEAGFSPFNHLLNQEMKIVQNAVNENLYNFFTDALSFNSKDIFPGRTLYRKKYIPLPYSNHFDSNLPNVYVRKKRINFEVKKNN